MKCKFILFLCSVVFCCGELYSSQGPSLFSIQPRNADSIQFFCFVNSKKLVCSECGNAKRVSTRAVEFKRANKGKLSKDQRQWLRNTIHAMQRRHLSDEERDCLLQVLEIN